MVFPWFFPWEHRARPIRPHPPERALQQRDPAREVGVQSPPGAAQIAWHQNSWDINGCYIYMHM